MSYTFLLDQGEESSAECFSDIPACVRLRFRNIEEKFFSNANETESCRDSRSGMMSKHLTEIHGEELSIQSVAVSRAKTLASLEKVRELQANEAGYGSTCSGSFAKFDQVSCLWKIPQLSLFEDLIPSLVIWPRWGLMRNGECLELPMPSGLKELRYLIMKGTVVSSRLPTPTVCGNYNRKGASMTSGDGLVTALRRLPTPTTQDGCIRKFPKRHKVTKTGIVRHLNEHGAESQIRLNQQIAAGGPMNPEWVEWFMGWPIGWTGLNPLEMDKFQQWLNFIRRP